MPGRKIPLVTGEVYHVMNRGIAGRPIFLRAKDYQRFLAIMRYYNFVKPLVKYSMAINFSRNDRDQLFSKINQSAELWVEVIAYCLMPNHFHLLLKQKRDGGVSKYIGQISNSHTRYINTLKNRVGPLLQGKFKAIRVETDEQLLQVSRYIHLNPYTGYVVKNLNQLASYPYSSLKCYLDKKVEDDICDPKIVLDLFSGRKAYQKFIYNQANYQRELGKIKHLLLEEIKKSYKNFPRNTKGV